VYPQLIIYDNKLKIMLKINQVFGCRSPTSEGEGKLDGAFIFCDFYNKDKYDKTSIIFNEYNYTKSHDTVDEALVDYNKLISQGWVPMTLDDIKKTSDIQHGEITNDTIIGPNKGVKKEYQMSNLFIVMMALSFLVFFV
jgi:hypothetical protein